MLLTTKVLCVSVCIRFNSGWCSKPCYAISYGRKSKLEKAGHFEAQTCDRPWGRGWGGGQGGRLIPIRRLAQMHKYTSMYTFIEYTYTQKQTVRQDKGRGNQGG